MAEEKRISAGLSQLQTAFLEIGIVERENYLFPQNYHKLFVQDFSQKVGEVFSLALEISSTISIQKHWKCSFLGLFFNFYFFISIKYVILPPVLHPIFFFVSRIHEEVQYNGEKIVNNSLFPVFNDQTFSVGQFIETGRKLTRSWLCFSTNEKHFYL